MSDSPDAASGEKPSPISIAAVTATGVPKPEAPSKNAPNAKAIKSNCNRRSAVTPPIACCRIGKAPVATVSRYMKMTLRTDPADREKTNDRPQDAGANGEPSRHREEQDCDQDCDRESNQRGEMGFNRTCRNQHQQRDNRDRRGNCRQHRIAERVVDLLPHVRFLPTPPPIRGVYPRDDAGSPFFRQARRSRSRTAVLVNIDTVTSSITWDRPRRRAWA